jgi:hypothetical protein
VKFAPQESEAHAAGSEDAGGGAPARVDVALNQMRAARPRNSQACSTVQPLRKSMKQKEN